MKDMINNNGRKTWGSTEHLPLFFQWAVLDKKKNNHKLTLYIKEKSYFCIGQRTDNVALQGSLHQSEGVCKMHTWMLCLQCIFSILCLPLRAKCYWKYRQAQSAILIPLPCPSHAQSIHPSPTHFHSFTHIPTHTPSFTFLLPVDVSKALPPKEKALR